MTRESSGATAIEEHGTEEAGHHEERRHPEDVDREHEDSSEGGPVGVLVGPDLRLAVDERGVDHDPEQHHRRPHHVESVVSPGSGRPRMERVIGWK